MADSGYFSEQAVEEIQQDTSRQRSTVLLNALLMAVLKGFRAKDRVTR